jgi:tetratricopeptide (TPR) repeat protein
MAIHHLAFFEALAELPDESCPEWCVTSAGLLTLRFVDAWEYEGEELVRSDSWTMHSLLRTIKQIDARDSKRALLMNIVDTMRSVKRPGMTVIAPRLMAYARALQFDAKWALAADVYSAVLRQVGLFEDPSLTIQAYMQLGACNRVLARWDEARAAYSLAGELAEVVKDTEGMLRARLTEANVLIDRGNLPQAEEILDQTIRDAGRADLHTLRGLALQDRGVVARQRGQFEDAVRFGYEALCNLHEPAARDRAIADLAVAFHEIGLLSAARDANLMLAATACEQYTRWVALINLMELAAIDRREPVFEQYRRELATVELPATLAANYHYYASQGYCAFGRLEEGKAAMAQAIKIAETHRIGEVLIRAEEGLRKIEMGEVGTTVSSPPNLSHDVEKVATAIQEMRATAGVAG